MDSLRKTSSNQKKDLETRNFKLEDVKNQEQIDRGTGSKYTHSTADSNVLVPAKTNLIELSRKKDLP